MTSNNPWQASVGSRLRRDLLRVPLLLLALVCLLLALIVHGASILGIDSEAKWPQVWLLHGALFLIFPLALLAAGVVARQKALSSRDLLALFPTSVLLLIALAFVYALATFVLLAPRTGLGVPVVKDNHFFFNDHGVIREVTENEFHFQRSVVLRLYSSLWVYLYYLSAVLLLGARPPPHR